MSEQASPEKKGSFKSKAIKWGAILLGILLLIFMSIRWVGTGHYVGTISRVYEKTSEYRIEMKLADGSVHVFNNREMRFPYLKFDTANVQAEAQDFQRTQDIVKVTGFGFRNELFSWFPNAVNIELVAHSREAHRAKAEAIADATLQMLSADNALSAEFSSGGPRDALHGKLVEKILDIEVAK